VEKQYLMFSEIFSRAREIVSFQIENTNWFLLNEEADGHYTPLLFCITRKIPKLKEPCQFNKSQNFLFIANS